MCMEVQGDTNTKKFLTRVRNSNKGKSGTGWKKCVTGGDFKKFCFCLKQKTNSWS